MEQYNVTGMSCAACSARVEKAVSGVKGVTSCSVSLLTNSMGVEGTASPDAVIKAVEKAGYGASLKGAGANPAKSSDADALDGPRNSRAETQTCRIPRISHRSDVLLDGTYDVEFPAPALL